MNLNLTTILVVVIAFAIGYAFAMLDRRVTTSMKQSRDEARQQAKVVEKIVPEQSALSVVLDAQNQPRLRLDGAPVTPAQVSAEQRKRLIWLLNLVRPWVDASPVAAPAEGIAQPVPSAPVAAVAAPPPAKEPPAPQLSLVRGVRALFHDAVITEEPSQGTGIVRQIDAVLQEKLPDSSYASKDIHLEEGPAGEVFVLVGALKYNGIDAVPDPGIQTIIRESVSDWEKRAGR